MSLIGKVHTGTGAAVSLSTLGIPSKFRQLDVYANSGNSADAYIGGSSVAVDGTVDAWVQLAKGKSWHVKIAENEKWRFDVASIYVIAASSDLVHFAVVQ